MKLNNQIEIPELGLGVFKFQMTKPLMLSKTQLLTDIV